MISIFVFAIVALATVVFFGVSLPRMRMQRRAELLLAAMPDHEATAVYLSFPSAWPSAKRALLKSKKEEKESSGWTYLRASEVSPLQSFWSSGGGLTLHFIRKKTANQSPEPTPRRGSSVTLGKKSDAKRSLSNSAVT
jgi:hypothetical protein